MQRDLIIKGRSLGGSSDLTLLAPIKPGFVESLESVTYKTRIKLVLETLHGGRMASHEFHTARLLSDAVERVGAIHSVRVAVLEPEDKVLLAVTFDGSWQSYIRVLWDKVGMLLDLIFCGTVEYVTAHGHSFDEWLVWVNRVQVETGFFYGPSEGTARDLRYHRRLERMQVRGLVQPPAPAPALPPDLAELQAMRAVLPSAEQTVERLANPPDDLRPDDPQHMPVRPPRMLRERIRNGVQATAALYRLTDLHRPSTPDGDVLRRAAIELLLEFVRMRDDRLIDLELANERPRFERQLDWLFPDGAQPVLVRRPAPPPAEDDGPIPLEVRRDVQGGILHPYDDITHGLVLIVAFDDAAAVLRFLKWMHAQSNWITRDIDPHKSDRGRVFRNIAFTPEGLRMAGLGEDDIDLFPEEFRQGMASRAGQLGDVRNNHPRRWRLPLRFTDIDTKPGPETVAIESIHAVIHLRCKADGAQQDKTLEIWERHHPLRKEVSRLLRAPPKLRVLAIQPLRRRYLDRDGAPVIADHFGYRDGDGQPQLEPTVPVPGTPTPIPFRRNRLHFGEIVLGHVNAADFPVDLDDPTVPEPAKSRQRWLTNGSFLVLRKYRQFVGRLEKAVNDTATEMERKLGGNLQDHKEAVYARLMGRDRMGLPLVPIVPGNWNTFTYDADRTGTRCPLGAHIRLANPRNDRLDAARLPRLIRRSMSYGSAHVCGEAQDPDRGLLFTAYNASISEQYEVVQRWLSGGNSTGSSSGQVCPIVGVPENGLKRTFRFEYTAAGATHIFRVALEGSSDLFEDPQVAAQLEWGLYLFAPSIGTLLRLCAAAATAKAVRPGRLVPWEAARGRLLIATLRRVESDQGVAAAAVAWKAAIEDPYAIDRLEGASLWFSIRADHGGILRTPYGVLVADRDLQLVVYRTDTLYSVCGQLDRMRRSFGEISLGLDAGPVYEQQSREINKAIGELTAEETFDVALAAADRKIDAIVAKAKSQSVDVGDHRFQVGLDMREVADEVLGDLCEVWFGLADDPGGRFRRGPADWQWKRGEKPLYPGHFTALSRYMFQPNPGPLAESLGQRYGQALREAMVLFVADHRKQGSVPKIRGNDTRAPQAPLAAAAFSGADCRDTDFVARMMVGILMGFNPTIIGAILNVLREWQRDGTFGALRASLAGQKSFAAASAVLDEPMRHAAQMRPMPQVGWRTALKSHRLGVDEATSIDIVAGDRIVMAMVSGTQQSLEDGRDDGRLMFGGKREEKDHPTHACPGYVAGIGAMLGALTALLSRTETIRPQAAPLSFLVEGLSGFPIPSPPPSVPPPTNRTSPLPVPPVTSGPPPSPPVTSRGLILGWGDSWLDRPVGADLRDKLAAFGYEVPEKFCKYSEWPRIETMAASPDRFCRFLENTLISPKRPLALLLSGGGNDSTEDRLRAMLVPKTPSTSTPIDDTKLKQHIAKLEVSYRTVLTRIDKIFKDLHVTDIPVIVHGYDHPFPAGFTRLTGQTYAMKWMRTPFKDFDWKWPADRKATTKAMRHLIDELNVMLAKLEATFSFVRHVDLRETIETAWPRAAEQHWFDDLHPDDDACELLAGKVDEAIQKYVTAVSAAPAPSPGAIPSPSIRKRPRSA